MDSAYAGLCFSSEQSRNKSANAIKTTANVHATKENGETELGVVPPCNSMNSHKAQSLSFYRMFVFYTDAVVSSGKQQLYFPVHLFKVLANDARLETFQAIILKIGNTKYDSIQFNFFVLYEDLNETYKIEMEDRCKQLNCKREIHFPVLSQISLLTEHKQISASIFFGKLIRKHFADFTKIEELTPKALTLYNLFLNKLILAVVNSDESNEMNLIFPLSNFEGYSVQEYTNYIEAIISKIYILNLVPSVNFYFINDPEKNQGEYMNAISSLAEDIGRKISFYPNVPNKNATNLYITPLDCEKNINFPDEMNENTGKV